MALDDDKGLFPPYFLAPVVRMETIAGNPKVVETLERVGALLDNPTMQELNRQVEVDKKEPRQRRRRTSSSPRASCLKRRRPAPELERRQRDRSLRRGRCDRRASGSRSRRRRRRPRRRCGRPRRRTRGRLNAAARVERFAGGERAVYGLNTGLGAAVDTPLAADDIGGVPASRRYGPRRRRRRTASRPRSVRATAVRAACAASRGRAPASRRTLPKPSAAMLNAASTRGRGASARSARPTWRRCARRPVPARPGRGGARRRDPAGPPRPSRRAGMKPVAFGPKDGIALLNCQCRVASAPARWCSHDAQRACSRRSMPPARCRFEAFAPISRRSIRALRRCARRPDRSSAAARLTALLAGSDLWTKGCARRVQDPLRFRCLAPVHGAARRRTAIAAIAAIEADSTAPATIRGARRGRRDRCRDVNFDTTALALALRRARPGAGARPASARGRAHRQADVAGLHRPAALPDAGTAAAAPASPPCRRPRPRWRRRSAISPCPLADDAPVADGVEDYATMTPRIVAKTREIVDAAARARRRRTHRRGAGGGSARARQARARARRRRMLRARPRAPCSTTTVRSAPISKRVAARSRPASSWRA